MRLRDKVALITGGGSGIGKSTAELFHREGARVAIAGRRGQVLEETARGIGDDVYCHPCDVTDESAVQSMIKDVIGHFERIDVLVLSAGALPGRTDITSTDLETFNKTITANVTSAFLVAREAIPFMPPGGSIIMVGSGVGLQGWPNMFSMTAAKGALHAATRQMAHTLGKDGIRVNLVAPAMVRTQNNADRLDTMSPEAMEELLAEYPLGAIGETIDVANACLYLGSDEAKWVTGVVLPVDGGRSV